MKDSGSKKNRKREAVALALISSRTISEAALAAGVSESTLYRWRTEPEFKAIMDRVKADALDTASNNLAALSAGAVEVLQGIAYNEEAPPAQRVSAARAMLETAFKLREQDDIIKRLDALERNAAEMSEKNDGW